MLYAVIFTNSREELVIKAIEAPHEEKAIEWILQAYSEEYEENIDSLYVRTEAVEVESGKGIYHQNNR